jgi:hypothetical protein
MAPANVREALARVSVKHAPFGAPQVVWVDNDHLPFIHVGEMTRGRESLFG